MTSGTVSNCNFVSNSASSRYGGAIYFYGMSDCNVVNCNFNNNMAEFGGAVFFKGDGNVTNCNFNNNLARTEGGAIIFFGKLNIKNCLFDSNQAKGALIAQCNGAAIDGGQNVIIDSSRFINNYAEDYGGAVYAKSVTFTNNPSYFIGNIAVKNQGGAIHTNKITNDVVSNVFFYQ